mgnify:CR=1 FL=1
MKPLLEQLVRLEQAYESDEVVLALAGQRGAIWRFGLQQVTPILLQQELNVKVNVGLSATDPVSRVQRLTMGIEAAVALGGPMAQQLLKLEELIPEIFNAVVYPDGKRFFNNMETGEDPRIVLLQQQLQQLQQQIETKSIEENARNERMTRLQEMKSQEGVTREVIKAETKLKDTAMKNATSLEVSDGANRTNFITQAMNGRRGNERGGAE